MILKIIREIVMSMFILFVLIILGISGFLYFGLSNESMQESNHASSENDFNIEKNAAIDLTPISKIKSNFEEIDIKDNDSNYLSQFKKQESILDNNKAKLDNIINNELKKIEKKFNNKIIRKKEQIDEQLLEFEALQERYIEDKISEKQKEYKKKVEEIILKKEDSHLQELGELERELLGENYSKKFNLHLKLNIIELSDREQLMYENELEQIEDEITEKLTKKESKLIKEFEQEIEDLENKYHNKLKDYREELKIEKENKVQNKKDELEDKLNNYISEQERIKNEVISQQKEHLKKLYQESINFQKELINKLN